MPSWPLAPPSPGHRGRQDVLLAVIVVSFSALLLAILALLLLLFCLYRSLRRAHTHDPTLPLDALFASSLRRFSFRDLCSATASFDPSRSLGRGASIVVFRGILLDGKSIDIKCLDHPSSSPPPPLPKPPPIVSSTMSSKSSLPSPLCPSSSPSLATASTAPAAAFSSMSTCLTAASKMPSSPPPIIISSSAGIAGLASSSMLPRPSSALFLGSFIPLHEFL